MIRGLRARLAFIFIGMVTGILVIATVILIFVTHYHITMFLQQIPESVPFLSHLNIHFERAMLQSITFTEIGAVLVAIFVSLSVTKRIITPLADMRKAAEQMRQGDLASRVVIQGHDELADLGQSLNHLAEQLQKQEELRKTMTADIAHELRTPLSTLKSHMEAFEDGIWEPTPERIHSCYEEIERLIHLVGDLEELTYMESPEFSLHLQREDIRQILRQAISSVKAAYFQKNVQLNLGDGEPVLVDVDQQRIGQILVNLLTNALKFTSPGGSVQVEVYEEKEQVVISVVDTGIGMAKNEIPFVFERFYRVDKSRNRKYGGGGIGLTIVKRLVEAHGGQVAIESEQGKGTKVSILLPKNQ